MSYKISEIAIKRFRSLINVSLKVVNGQPVIICGENNIGKTNVLEALNVFFNHSTDPSLYFPERDIPHHIYYGRGGEAQNSEIAVTFEFSEAVKSTVKIKFKKDCSIEYHVSDKKNLPQDAQKKAALEILKSFKFFYVESNNVDIPSLVSELFSSDGLIKLDTKRAKQKKPMETLKEFQKQAQVALLDIQKELNTQLQELNILPSNNSQQDIIKITFAEFDKLRDVVSRMTEITIDDGNDHSISAKGSGAQRTALLTLMNYIASNAKKNVVWGLDEPEIFLQPKAQKKLFRAIKEISRRNKQSVILTTHSQHFIDLNNLDHTHLFSCDVEKKEYKRVIGRQFFEKTTKPKSYASNSEKAKDIREHLGIDSNDGWNLLPVNILVEGETDKKYLSSLAEMLNVSYPSIISAGSASKIAGQLQFFNTLAEDLDFRPTVRIVLDNDEEGRKAEQAISRNISKDFYSSLVVELYFYPRSDGLVKTGNNKNWEVEDFLPTELVFEGINRILKKAKYKIVSKQYRDKKIQPSNIDKPILEYAENASSMINSQKRQFDLQGVGQKMSLCLQIINALEQQNFVIPDVQKNFIYDICGSTDN